MSYINFKRIALEVNDLIKPHAYEKFTKIKLKEVKIIAAKYNFHLDYDQGKLPL
jgi:hypothetical protein